MLRAYGDGNIFGEPYGEGPVCVVWLHGWARRGQDFEVCANTLATRGIASVALDLPGFGSSPPPTVAGGARHYATLLSGVLSQISPEPLILVGHSFGGTVATVLAATHPELVSNIVLTGAPVLRSPSSSKPPLQYRVLRTLYRKGVVSDERMEAARQRFGSVDYRNARGIIRQVLVAAVNESYEDELAQLAAPVAMLWGELDSEVPVAVAQRALEFIQSDRSLRVVSGVGHLLPLEAPNELLSEVEKILG